MKCLRDYPCHLSGGPRVLNTGNHQPGHGNEHGTEHFFTVSFFLNASIPACASTSYFTEFFEKI